MSDFPISDKPLFRSIIEFEHMAEEACSEWKGLKHKDPLSPLQECKVVKLAQSLLCDTSVFLSSSLAIAVRSPLLTYKLFKYNAQAFGMAQTIIAQKPPVNSNWVTVFGMTFAEKELLRTSITSLKEKDEELCSSLPLKRVCPYNPLAEKKLISIVGEQGKKLAFSKTVFSLLFPEYLKMAQRRAIREIETPFLSENSLEEIRSLCDGAVFDSFYFSEKKGIRPPIISALEILALADMLAPADYENLLYKYSSASILQIFNPSLPEATEETRVFNILDTDGRWTLMGLLLHENTQVDEKKERWSQELLQLYNENQDAHEKHLMLCHVLTQALSQDIKFSDSFSRSLNRPTTITLSSFTRLAVEKSLAGIGFRTKPVARLELKTQVEIEELKQFLLLNPPACQYIKEIVDLSGQLTPSISTNHPHTPGEDVSCVACLYRYHARIEGDNVIFSGNKEDVDQFIADSPAYMNYQTIGTPAQRQYLSPNNTKTWAELKPEHESTIAQQISQARNPWL